MAEKRGLVAIRLPDVPAKRFKADENCAPTPPDSRKLLHMALTGAAMPSLGHKPTEGITQCIHINQDQLQSHVPLVPLSTQLNIFPSTSVPFYPFDHYPQAASILGNTRASSKIKERNKGKEDIPPSFPEEIPDAVPPPTHEALADPLAAKVIDHFSARWETFKSGFAADIQDITNTLKDPKEGLITKVATLETEVKMLKAREKGVAGTQPPPEWATRIQQLETKYQQLSEKCNSIIAFTTY